MTSRPRGPVPVQMEALNQRVLVQWTVSQHLPAVREWRRAGGGAGRKPGQQRGSAAALNDYTGLNLLGRGQTGSGGLRDSAGTRCGGAAPFFCGALSRPPVQRVLRELLEHCSKTPALVSQQGALQRKSLKFKSEN